MLRRELRYPAQISYISQFGIFCRAPLLPTHQSAPVSILLIGQVFENSEIRLSSWVYPGYFAGDFRPVPELGEITIGPATERMSLRFIIGSPWI